MDASTNLQMVTAGLAMGSIYALVALGFVLIFNAVGVVNFAQGEFVMVPAFVAVWLMDVLKIPFPLTYVITVIFMGVFGIVFQRIAYYPLAPPDLPSGHHRHHRRLHLPQERGADGLRGRAVSDAAADPPDVLNLAGVFVDPQYIVIIVATLALLVFQYFFFEKTSLGKKMQATAQDKEMARLLGIRVATMIAITFAYSSILGAAAGILVGPIFYVTKEMGAHAGAQGVLLHHRGRLRKRARGDPWGTLPGGDRGIRRLLHLQRLPRRLCLHHSDPGPALPPAGILRREDRREGIRGAAMSPRAAKPLLIVILALAVLLFPWAVTSSYWLNLVNLAISFSDGLPRAEHRPGIRGPAFPGPGGLLGRGGLHLGRAHGQLRDVRLGWA